MPEFVPYRLRGESKTPQRRIEAANPLAWREDVPLVRKSGYMPPFSKRTLKGEP